MVVFLAALEGILEMVRWFIKLILVYMSVKWFKL